MISSLSYINLCLCVTGFKFLFLKSYVSTDFDVHRNWMAITYNLPIKDWYFDTTSQWTLDYPPLFAAFEFLLALVAHCLGLADALALSESPIRTEAVIVYQKITVLLGDFVYYFAVYKLCHACRPILSCSQVAPTQVPATTTTTTTHKTNNNEANKPTSNKSNAGQNHEAPRKQQPDQKQAFSQEEQLLCDALYRPNGTSAMAILLILQPGLLLVDHIHFQYNGLLSGLLLLSMANIIEGRHASGSFWFAVLLNFKHIYLYCAPAIGMYLLTSYCLAKVKDRNRFMTFMGRAGRLGSVVVLVFIATYSPFGDFKTLGQIVSRLFPFKRGLTHAYWAPNAWSLYNLADKTLATLYRDSLKVNFDIESISRTKQVTSTSGLVQEYEHQYLPTIRPASTFILVAIFTLPIVAKFLFMINRTSTRHFIKGVTLAAFTSFMFGWHVHEKAVILILLPMVPICCLDPHLKDLFLRLSLAGTYALFPLLFEPAEYLTKVSLLIAYYSYANSIELRKNGSKNRQARASYTNLAIRTLDKAFILAIIVNEIYCSLLFDRLNYAWNPLTRLNKYKFLPLMMTSSLSALGICFSYLQLYYEFLSS